MPKVKKIGRIEDETVLMPWVIAQAIVWEVAYYLRADELPGLEKCLTDRAQTVYENNETFHKKIKRDGDAARDHLYVFMRHWAAAWVHRERGIKMPDSFCVGNQLPEGERYKPLFSQDIVPGDTFKSLSVGDRFVFGHHQNTNRVYIKLSDDTYQMEDKSNPMSGVVHHYREQNSIIVAGESYPLCHKIEKLETV